MVTCPEPVDGPGPSYPERLGCLRRTEDRVPTGPAPDLSRRSRACGPCLPGELPVSEPVANCGRRERLRLTFPRIDCDDCYRETRRTGRFRHSGRADADVGARASRCAEDLAAGLVASVIPQRAPVAANSHPEPHPAWTSRARWFRALTKSSDLTDTKLHLVALQVPGLGTAGSSRCNSVPLARRDPIGPTSADSKPDRLCPSTSRRNSSPAGTLEGSPGQLRRAHRVTGLRFSGASSRRT